MGDVASDLIDNIEGYQQLLTTLSLGVSAGAFAFLVQIMMHNAQGTTRITLSYTPLVFFGIGLNLLAILFGVATKSALVSSVPALHAIDWGSQSAVASLSNAGLNHITWLSTFQILSFLLGALVLVGMLFLNRDLLK